MARARPGHARRRGRSRHPLRGPHRHRRPGVLRGHGPAAASPRAARRATVDPEGMAGFGRFTDGEIASRSSAPPKPPRWPAASSCSWAATWSSPPTGQVRPARGEAGACSRPAAACASAPASPWRSPSSSPSPATTIDAQRAYELGLVNQVVPADQVLDDAVALAERIARNGPLALQATKELVRRQPSTPRRPRSGASGSPRSSAARTQGGRHRLHREARPRLEGRLDTQRALGKEVEGRARRHPPDRRAGRGARGGSSISASANSACIFLVAASSPKAWSSLVITRRTHSSSDGSSIT